MPAVVLSTTIPAARSGQSAISRATFSTVGPSGRQRKTMLARSASAAADPATGAPGGASASVPAASKHTTS